MPEHLSLEEAFLKCKRDGKFLVREEAGFEEIRSTILIADADIQSADTIKKKLDKNSAQWSTVYKLYYDALHELAEAFLRFEKVKIDNHQCLFAYLCEKHPELDFSWDFLEKARTKRNGIHYYGRPVDFENWNEVELQFTLYIKKLKEEIKARLK
jgi:hypothetical protein